MKIAFWSEQQRAGVTFNLAVTACAAVWRHSLSVAVVSGGYRDEKLERCFFKTAGSSHRKQELGGQYGRESALAAESEEFFLSSGLECLLQKEYKEDLTEMVVKANMRQIVREKMYFLPSNARTEQEWWYRDRLFARMDRVMEAVESYFDVVFIDCGSRKDDYARKVLREADVCVLNMDQEAQNIGEYYRNLPKFRGETFFLLGFYFEEALYNRENLQRLYRMEENRLGAIPYQPRMQEAIRMGRIQKAVKDCVSQGAAGKYADFARELIRSTDLILKLAGVIA